jgi:REP element-mobilizing transposase RayT
MYFVTICTRNREHYFGEIILNQEGEAILQPTLIGEIAHSEWYKCVELRPDMNLELGEFVVMPNHIHGIVMIGRNEFNTPTATNKNILIEPQTDIAYKNSFGPQRKNLSSILRGYKSAVTVAARNFNIEFEWQSRFHEHIIRSMDDYYRISNYIINNPSKWNQDKFYT